MEYRYALEKYGGPSTKHICPSCNHKTFTRYIDRTNEQALGDTIGRCDRSEKCGFHLPPKSMGKRNVKLPERAIISKTKKSTSYLHFSQVKSTLNNYKSNSFIVGLEKFFDPETIQSLIQEYYIGTIEDKVVFWQIDELKRVRSGKIMQYNTKNLKRLKYVSWAHSYYHLKNFNINQCFYGQHLSNDPDSKRPVCVVESEKTAILMKGFYPKLIWMATGGLHNLNLEKIKALKERQIYLYPDIGCENDWKSKVYGAKNVKLVNWSKAMNVYKKGDDPVDYKQPNIQMPVPDM